MIIDAGPLQTFAGSQEMPSSQARPVRASHDARRASDQALHQSWYVEIEPVTSSKSVNTTPLATKRGPQCVIAALSKGSDDMRSSFSL